MIKKIETYDLHGEIRMLKEMLRREIKFFRIEQVGMLNSLLSHAKRLAKARESAVAEAKRVHVDKGIHKGKCCVCGEKKDVRDILCGYEYKKFCDPCGDNLFASGGS